MGEIIRTDVGNGWQRVSHTYDAEVIVNPPWWVFWRKSYREMRTFTTSGYAKEGADDNSLLTICQTIELGAQ